MPFDLNDISFVFTRWRDLYFPANVGSFRVEECTVQSISWNLLSMVIGLLTFSLRAMNLQQFPFLVTSTTPAQYFTTVNNLDLSQNMVRISWKFPGKIIDKKS